MGRTVPDNSELGEELYMSGSKVLPIKCIGHRNVEGNVKTDFDKFLLVKSVRNACEVSWYACWVVGSEDRYANKSIPSLYDFQWAVPFRLLDMDQPSVGFWIQCYDEEGAKRSVRVRS